MPETSGRRTRREFVSHSIGLAAAGLVGRAASAQAAARSSPRVLGANDRIRLGIIGCGDLGTGHHIPKVLDMSRDPALNVELAAVCDIYEPRKQRAAKMTGAPVFHDYRKMLDEARLDGVIVVTPDHWHAKMTLDAMEAGLDVHVEKPMTLYWEEAKKVYEASVRLKRIVQVGAEGTSRDNVWQAGRLIREGKIGRIVWATGGVYRNTPGGDWQYPMDADASPKTLDWDAFLGPAPRRPFEPERYFRYRKYWDYSGGVAHDLIAHVLSALQVAIGPQFPTRVSAAGGIYGKPDRETPDTFSMQVEYPAASAEADHSSSDSSSGAGGYLATLFCTQTTEAGVQMAIRGREGTIRWPHGRDRNEIEVTPEGAYHKDTTPYTVGPQPRDDHDVNFIKCMRSRGQTHCPPLTGYKVMVALDLANRSWREGKTFTFDPQRQEIVSPGT